MTLLLYHLQRKERYLPQDYGSEDKSPEVNQEESQEESQNRIQEEKGGLDDEQLRQLAEATSQLL